MKRVPEAVLAALVGRFGHSPQALEVLGGGREENDGIVYLARQEDRQYVLKITCPQAQAPVQARAALFAYFGAHGVPVITPVPSAGGNLIEAAREGETLYCAYQYPFLRGAHPGPERWTEAVVQGWGRLIGRTHALAKDYPIWQGSPEVATVYQEMDSFIGMCRDADVGAAWQDIRARVAALAYTRETAGFIHNDPHMQNVLVAPDGQVQLLDFDVANCHFFASDLAIAIQSVLFTRGGGMMGPVTDQGAVDWFVKNLLAGYRQANALPEAALGSIGLFVAYRRCLLFCVMQQWLADNPQARDSMKRMIRDEPAIVRL